MFIIIKGLIIGLGKIIPGVSGSILAISLGVYEKCIDIISNLKIELKHNIKFLFLLCIGIILGIVIGSKIVYHLLDKYYVQTMSLFIGLIIGTIPSILKKVKITKNDYKYLVLPFVLIYIIFLLPPNELKINTILIGLIDAFTMIVPGISGTAIFMILGVYDEILILFSNIFNFQIILYLIGLVIGILMTTKIINYGFKNYSNESYIIILSLVISSTLYLIKDTFYNIAD